MAIVSISMAAKLVRKGRQTLYNHNEKGKLSFTKTTEGKPGVDTSELERVYGKLYMSAQKAATVIQDTPLDSDSVGQPGLNADQKPSEVDNNVSKSVSLDIDAASTVSWFMEQVDETKRQLAESQAELAERDNTLAELRKAIAVLPSPESVEQRLAEQADRLKQQHNEVIETERDQLAQVLADQRRQEAHQLKKWEQSIADRQSEIQQLRAEASEIRHREAEQAKLLKAERDRMVALESRGFIARMLNKKTAPSV